MPVPPLPPLRIQEADGSPNIIPVFEIVVTNGTLTDLGGGRVRLATGGAGGGGGDAGQVTVGSAFFESVAGGVVFANSSQLLYQEAPLLFWDEAANRLGVGTSAPGVVLDVVGSARTQGQHILTLDAASAGHAVRGNRTISTTAPVAGGGNLTADRTLTVDTAVLVTSGRTINTTEPIRGGGNLSADRTITIAAASATSAGALSSADFLTFNAKADSGHQYVLLAAVAGLPNERVLTASTGLALTDGGAGGSVSLSVNANVRRSTAGFFAGGNLSTAMIPEEARVYIPHNVQILEVRLAVTTTPVGANILCQVYQFPTPTGVGSAFYSAGSRPIITTGNAAGAGSGGGTLLNDVAYTGSWLGFSVDQVGSTTPGSNLTLTVIGISS